MPDSAANAVRKLIGQKIDGGCEHCDAHQTVDELRPHFFNIVVHHEDDCPFLNSLPNLEDVVSDA